MHIISRDDFTRLTALKWLKGLYRWQAARPHLTHTANIVLLTCNLSQDDFTRLTALKWLKEFVEMASSQLVRRYGDLIGAVLPNISHSSKEIQQVRSLLPFCLQYAAGTWLRV